MKCLMAVIIHQHNSVSDRAEPSRELYITIAPLMRIWLQATTSNFCPGYRFKPMIWQYTITGLLSVMWCEDCGWTTSTHTSTSCMTEADYTNTLFRSTTMHSLICRKCVCVCACARTAVSGCVWVQGSSTDSAAGRFFLEQMVRGPKHNYK